MPQNVFGTRSGSRDAEGKLVSPAARPRFARVVSKRGRGSNPRPQLGSYALPTELSALIPDSTRRQVLLALGIYMVTKPTGGG